MLHFLRRSQRSSSGSAETTRSALMLVLLASACGGSEPAPRAPAAPGELAPAPAAQAGLNPAPCVRRDSAAGEIEGGARTAGASAELGGKVALEGVKTFGRAVGGFFQGGSERAGEQWHEGADRTRSVAREEATQVKATTAAPPCPDAPPDGNAAPASPQ